MSEEPSPPQRPDLYVVARFLDRLAGGSTDHNKSSLQRATRTNYDLFRSYLALLEEKGWIRWEPREGRGQDRIHLSKEGQEAYDELVGWIEEALGHGVIDP
jgi:MarR-like DNA-binding transcriptional regulator SgrR of sgrS sRNA